MRQTTPLIDSFTHPVPHVCLMRSKGSIDGVSSELVFSLGALFLSLSIPQFLSRKIFLAPIQLSPTYVQRGPERSREKTERVLSEFEGSKEVTRTDRPSEPTATTVQSRNSRSSLVGRPRRSVLGVFRLSLDKLSGRAMFALHATSARNWRGGSKSSCGGLQGREGKK